MATKPIYEPAGKALEYADLALNIYNGCPHGCVYCYAPAVMRKNRTEFLKVEPRKDIVTRVSDQLRDSKGSLSDKLVHLCFTCDPYPRGFDSSTTTEIIKLLKENDVNVQILTKNGIDCRKDFGLLGPNDMSGVTISCSEEQRPKLEPGSTSIADRLDALKEAKLRGIGTWVSCEPVFDIDTVYDLIESDFIDLYKFGKLNYMPSDIDWKEFGINCRDYCQKLGRKYIIKKELLDCMFKQEEL